MKRNEFQRISIHRVNPIFKKLLQRIIGVNIEGIVSEIQDESVLEFPDIAIGKWIRFQIGHKLGAGGKNIGQFYACVYTPEFMADRIGRPPSKLKRHFKTMGFNFISFEWGLIADDLILHPTSGLCSSEVGIIRIDPVANPDPKAYIPIFVYRNILDKSAKQSIRQISLAYTCWSFQQDIISDT